MHCFLNRNLRENFQHEANNQLKQYRFVNHHPSVRGICAVFCSIKCYLKHSWSILFLVALLFEEHVVNKEQCPEQCRLYPHVQIHRKVDAKVVRVREHLAREARPLLGDLSHLIAISGDDLELHVTADAERTARSLDLQHRLSGGVLDAELGRKN